VDRLTDRQFVLLLLFALAIVTGTVLAALT
jgi:hypothetical protein